eukprot:COSAG06_NODE_14495_length_1151_cov_2.519962_1_plen_211_part_00
MLHDRYLYDRSTRKWTVDKFLDDLTTRYGGIDSVLLWQFYPNAGIDARNNFDYIDSLPGGKAAAKQLVADFHRHGVKVLWPYFPWDVGTRNTGQPQYVSQIAWMKKLGADGFNGDTVRGINISFWHEAISQHTPVVMEPEIMGNKVGYASFRRTETLASCPFLRLLLPLVACPLIGSESRHSIVIVTSNLRNPLAARNGARAPGGRRLSR